MPSKKENEARVADFSEAEFLELVSRMTAYTVNKLKGRWWRNKRYGTLPKGEDAHTIVQTAFEKLLAGAKWDQEKPAWLVLKGIIDGRVQSLVQSSENRQSLDCGGDTVANSLASVSDATASSQFVDPSEAAENSEAEERIWEIVEELEKLGKQEEAKIVEAFINGCTKRSEVMEETGISERSYEAAKKRLRRFLENSRQDLASGNHN